MGLRTLPPVKTVFQADARAAAAAYGSGMLGAVASTSADAHRAAGHAALWPAIVLVATLVLMVGLSLWWLRRGDDDDQDGGWGWGGGGSEGSPPEPPEPAWWPEFEREFAAYVTSGARSAAR